MKMILAFCFSAALICSAQAQSKVKVSGFDFAVPAAWKSVQPSSSMRKAQLVVTDEKAKQKGEIIFFHFGEGSAGGTQANVDRWFGQFEEPKDKIKAKSEPVTINKHKVTFVEAEGTYKSGMPGGPTTALPNHALLGAIIEDEQGSVFIRFTGPKELVRSSQGDFRKMVESALK